MIEENFLHRIEFSAESAPGGVDERWNLTNANLERLGFKLRS
jgi:hypothetical protein